MDIDKLISKIRSLREEAVAVPTNNISSGNIAGTREAGDDPPVHKKKKKYNELPTIIGRGKFPGARKRWMK